MMETILSLFLATNSPTQVAAAFIQKAIRTPLSTSEELDTSEMTKLDKATPKELPIVNEL
jgi:hypothetical protein